MGKILQISIYSVLLILVFLFFGSMIKSCGNSAAETISDTTQKVADNIENAGGEIIAKAESAMEDIGEEFEGEDINFADTGSETTSYTADSKKPEPTNTETTTTQESSSSSDDSEDYEPSYIVEEAPPTPVAPAPVKKEPVRQSTTSSSSSSSSSSGASGRYLLITGNYSQEGNAAAMVKKLKEKGFTNAEYVIFEGSRYYTALAGKYSSMSSANSAKAGLGNIDAYVQKRRD